MDKERAAKGVLRYADVGDVLAVGVRVRVVVENIDCILLNHRYGIGAAEACRDQGSQTWRSFLLHAPFLLPSNAATL